MEDPVTAAVETSIADVSDAAPSVAGTGSIPVALADRMEDFPWAPGSDGAQAAAVSVAKREREPALHADMDVEPYAVPEPPADDVLVASEPRDRARYDAPGSGRMRAILFGIVFLAIAGTVYWSAVAPTQTSETRAPESAPAGETPAAAEPAAAAPAVAVPAAAEPAAAAPPATAESSAAAVETTTLEPRESTNDAAPRADASSPAPDMIPSTSVAAPADNPAAARSARSTGTKADATKPRDNDDARRRAAQRKREQAERDALATQRLIARQLGDTAHAPPAASPTSAP